MGYAILRAEPRTIQGTLAMLKHALREPGFVPGNAVPGSPVPQLLGGLSTSGEGMAKLRLAIDEARAARRWQKSVKPVLDVLVTFSHEDEKGLSEEAQADYFRRALDFCLERFGGKENLLSAVIHRDESTAHVQILMLARDQDTKKLGCSQFLGGRGDLHQLQNAFWQDCGQPYGLRRGEPRTGARHVPVRQLYSALAAGAEVPQLMQVPEVSVKDRLLNPEKMTQRDRAINHNVEALATLSKQAVRGKSLHPKIMAQEAERYRQARSQTAKAEKQAQEATERLHRLQTDIREGQGSLTHIEKQLEAKLAKMESIDSDIDRLRRLRDIERDEFGFGPGGPS